VGEYADFAGICLIHVNQAGVGGEERPLHIAARNGLIEDMRILLREGADVDAEGDLGMTPLHYAAMNGHIPAIELLLQSGANPAALDEHGSNAVSWARKHPEAVRILQAAMLEPKRP
jgi:ankyrin repeat protein